MAALQWIIAHRRKNHTKLASVGVYLLNYPKKFGTPMADMLTSTFLLNILLSMPYTKFMGIYIKNLPQQADGPI